MTTQTSNPSSTPPLPNDVLFQQLTDYPWDNDTEFQSGLQAILGPNPSPSQAEHLTQRARCFYFARKKTITVDFDAYQAWLARQPLDPATIANGTNTESKSLSLPSTPQSVPHQHAASGNGSEPPAPYPTSFSQIVELITNGEPIPGIRELPDTILKGQASQPSTEKRKKPWEVNNGGDGMEDPVPLIIS